MKQNPGICEHKSAVPATITFFQTTMNCEGRYWKNHKSLSLCSAFSIILQAMYDLHNQKKSQIRA